MADNTSQIAGLFMTPELYQQQQNDAALARGVQLAELDPFQRASAQLYQGGYMAGGAIGQALGAQDPMLQQLSTIQQLGSQFDLSSSTGNMQMAKALQDKGLAGPASQFAAKAAALRKDEATAMPEKQRLAISMADTKATRGTPEWKLAYEEALGEVINPEKLTATQKEYRQAVADKSFTGSFNDWLTMDANRKRPVTNVSVDVGKAISQVTGKAIGEQISKMGESLSGLSKFERSVDTVEKLLPNSFTGMGADTAKQLNKAATMVGASKGEKASNTEILENTFNNIVLPMARQLPGSIAAKELTFLLTTKPALQQEPATIRRLMKQMLEDYKGDAQTYEASQRYYKKNKSYEGFDINQARYNVGQRMNTMSSLEDKVRAGTATKDEAQKLLDMRQGKDQTND